MSGRRPFVVRWWDQEYVTFRGTSFATAEHAESEARRQSEEHWDVSWWERDEHGGVVGPIHRFGEGREKP